MKVSLATLPILLIALGCTPPTQTRTYSISVKNESTQPVVLWLTKDGPPYEPRWASPEDIAIESPKMDDNRINWVTVDPGKLATSGDQAGRFENRTSAVLRIYVGATEFSDLLSMSFGSPTRADLDLVPGQNVFVVKRAEPLIVERLTSK